MVTLEHFAALLITGLFALAAAIVAYDIYSATRLRWLLQPCGAPRKFRSPRPERQITRFGVAARATAAAHERRPKALWVARLASLEHKP
jgi:hypothetical protein